MSALQIINVVLNSLGGGVLILSAFCALFGKIIINRLKHKEVSEHELKLSEFRAKLNKELETYLPAVSSFYEVTQTKHLKIFEEKLQTYKKIVERISEILANFDLHINLPPIELDQQRNLSHQRYRQFINERNDIIANLTLIAPYDVVDAADDLLEHLRQIAEGIQDWEWSVIKNKSGVLLDRMRLDLKIESVSYKFQDHP